MSKAPIPESETVVLAVVDEVTVEGAAEVKVDVVDAGTAIRRLGWWNSTLRLCLGRLPLVGHKHLFTFGDCSLLILHVFLFLGALD